MQTISSASELRTALESTTPQMVYIPPGAWLDLGGTALSVSPAASMTIVGGEGATLNAGGRSRIFNVQHFKSLLNFKACIWTSE